MFLLKIDKDDIPEAVWGVDSHWWWMEASNHDTSSENGSLSSDSDTGMKQSVAVVKNHAKPQNIPHRFKRKRSRVKKRIHNVIAKSLMS